MNADCISLDLDVTSVKCADFLIIVSNHTHAAWQSQRNEFIVLCKETVNLLVYKFMLNTYCCLGLIHSLVIILLMKFPLALWTCLSKSQ